MREYSRLLLGFMLLVVLAQARSAWCGQGDLGGLKPENWFFTNGPEFPGAQGGLTAGTDDRGAPALLIRGDFSKGGNFIGAGRTFAAHMDITALTVRVYSTTGVLGLRVNDRSGQCFQQSIKLPANAWQDITLAEFGNPARKDIHHWGGARDGVFQRPATAIVFMLFKPVDEASKTGELRIARIRTAVVPAPPPVRPATVTATNLVQFWLTPDQPSLLCWQYVPGTDAAPATNLAYTLRDYAGATRETQALTIASNGWVTVTEMLPVGYYEAEIQTQRFGIVSQAPVAPEGCDPFFAIDAAMTSLGPFGREAARAQLIGNLARGGITMARERANWSGNNPTSGVWLASNRCDSVRQQLRQGHVAVLECFQDAPRWTGSGPADPYPCDLCGTRDAWVQLAGRWGGTWGGLEVWNEPNLIPHPADRWSPMLKAVTYAMREVLPEMPCGGGAFSTFDQPFMAQVAANRALDAMDFVSFHTYSPAPGIEPLVAQYRKWFAAAGCASMPLWLTEVGHPWARGPARPPLDQDQASALDMAMQVVEARACGIARVFPFIYGYYDEKQNDFGMMGRENTPLRSLAAYANLARVLAHRPFVGDLAGVDGVIRARVFAGAGNDQALIVLYTGAARTGALVSVNLPATRVEGVDGRRLAIAPDGRIPIADGLTFAWVPRSALASRLQSDTETVRLYRLSQQPPPARRPISPLVLRCVADPVHTSVNARGYDVPDPFDGHYTASVRVSNLGAKACRAKVRAAIAGTDAALRQETVEVPARGSVDLSWPLDLSHSLLAAEGSADLVFEATDGGNGDRLAMHLMRPVGIDVLLAHRPLRLDTPVREVQRWRTNVAAGATMTFAPVPEGGVRAVADFGASARDLWAYPQFFGLPPADAMRGVKGVVLRGRVDGGGTVRMFVAERNGAKYIHASPLFSADGQWHNVFVSFQDFAPFASIDPNGQLDPDQLDHIEIGCNTGARQCVIEISQLWFVGGETP